MNFADLIICIDVFLSCAYEEFSDNNISMNLCKAEGFIKFLAVNM
jgi:hypothetical protein